jgi:hypothetical protein
MVRFFDAIDTASRQDNLPGDSAVYITLWSWDEEINALRAAAGSVGEREADCEWGYCGDERVNCACPACHRLYGQTPVGERETNDG